MYFFPMKIEKISDNQIKFTLNRTDLASHQIKISELAYGTEKTRGLIQDMMEQASDEFGFEISDMPLMIEAIPVSMDCIVLMVTKVDEPEEVDTKFSGFTNLKDLLADDETDAEFPDTSEGSEPFRFSSDSASRISEVFPGRRSTTIRPGSALTERMFSFDSLDDVIDFAHQAGTFFIGESALYNSPEDNRYYLILKNTAGDLKSFGRVCNCALEYGSKEPFGFARGAFVDEHFTCIIPKGALQSLANV